MLLGLRLPFDIAVTLAALVVAVFIELISGILMVIGVVATIRHLRANGPRGGDPRAPVRRRMALRIALLVMWVLDRAPFRDPSRRERRGNR